MPEGDTVYVAARRLDAALGGRTLIGTDFRVPRLATEDLAGRDVRGVRSYGKHLFFDLGELTLHTHFMMDGSWHLYRPEERWRGPGFQVRAVLRTEPWTAVGFRLPLVELLETDAAGDVVAHLGPDLLGESWDEDEAVRRLQVRPERPVGEALLDQRNLAGLGNIYRAEVCFLRGVDPSTPVERVPDLAGMVRLAHRLIDANRDTGRQVTTGTDRPGARHWVYGRSRRACRRCGTAIESYEDGGGRLVFLCPSCQPAPMVIAGA